MKYIAVLFALVVGAITVSAQPITTYACSYAFPGVDEYYGSLDDVFLGELIDYNVAVTDPVEPTASIREHFTLEVMAVYKGSLEVGDTITITREAKEGPLTSCDLQPLFSGNPLTGDQPLFFAVEGFAGDTTMESDSPTDTAIWWANENGEDEDTVVEKLDDRYEAYYSAAAPEPETVDSDEESGTDNSPADDETGATDGSRRDSSAERCRTATGRTTGIVCPEPPVCNDTPDTVDGTICTEPEDPETPDYPAPCGAGQNAASGLCAPEPDDPQTPDYPANPCDGDNNSVNRNHSGVISCPEPEDPTDPCDDTPRVDGVCTPKPPVDPCTHTPEVAQVASVLCADSTNPAADGSKPDNANAPATSSGGSSSGGSKGDRNANDNAAADEPDDATDDEVADEDDTEAVAEDMRQRIGMMERIVTLLTRLVELRR